MYVLNSSKNEMWTLVVILDGDVLSVLLTSWCIAMLFKTALVNTVYVYSNNQKKT